MSNFRKVWLTVLGEANPELFIIPTKSHLPYNLWKDITVERTADGSFNIAYYHSLGEEYGRSLRAIILGPEFKGKRRKDGDQTVFLRECFE